MNKNSTYRLLLTGIAVAIVLAACGAPAPTSVPAQPSSVPTRAASSAAAVIATEAPALVPTRVVTRSAAAPSEAPSLIGEHPLNDIDLVLTLNADGTARLVAPAIDQGTAARSWQGQWVPDGEQSALVTLTSTAAGSQLLYQPVFDVAVVSDTVQLTEYVVGSTKHAAPEFQHSFGSGQRHPLIVSLNNLLAQVPYLNYSVPQQDADLYSDDVRRAVVRFQQAQGLHPTGVADQRTWLELLSPPYAKVPTTSAHFIVT